MLGQSFIRLASIVNKQFVSEEVSTKLEGFVGSIKELLSLFAMQWTEGASGNEPLGCILHVPSPPCQPQFLSSVPARRKETTDQSTMTSQTLLPAPTPWKSSPSPIFP